MKYIETEIPGVYILEPTIFADDRGYFTETYRKADFDKNIGYDVDFIQDNQSKSSYGVLRGLHFQAAPYTQAKLVRVIEGAVLDVAVDIRKGSPTFGQHVAVELTAENKRQLFVPRGFAHGFVVLSQEVVFAYKCDNLYAPTHERGLLFNDPALGIDWKIQGTEFLLSEKDTKNPLLKDADLFDYNTKDYLQ